MLQRGRWRGVENLAESLDRFVEPSQQVLLLPHRGHLDARCRRDQTGGRFTQSHNYAIEPGDAPALNDHAYLPVGAAEVFKEVHQSRALVVDVDDNHRGLRAVEQRVDKVSLPARTHAQNGPSVGVMAGKLHEQAGLSHPGWARNN